MAHKVLRIISFHYFLLIGYWLLFCWCLIQLCNNFVEFFFFIFRCVLASLWEDLSVCPSNGWSDSETWFMLLILKDFRDVYCWFWVKQWHLCNFWGRIINDSLPSLDRAMAYLLHNRISCYITGYSVTWLNIPLFPCLYFSPRLNVWKHLWQFLAHFGHSGVCLVISLGWWNCLSAW